MAAVLVAVAVAPVDAVAGSGHHITNGRARLLRPSTAVAVGAATHVLLRLPAGAAAVEGRVLLPPGTADVIGVVPLGRGRDLRPVPVRGGVRFGAWGLPAGRASTLAIVLVPRVRGGIPLRVVLDAIGDRSGHPVAARTSALTTVVGDGAGVRGRAAPRGTPRAVRPDRSEPRDVTRDGRVGTADLDTVRAAWLTVREGSRCRGGQGPRGDTDQDGCLDVLDLQAITAALRSRTGRQGGDAPRRAAARRAMARRAVAAGPGGVDAVTHTVTSPLDTRDALPGDGVCADAAALCTLRAAIEEAEARVGDDVIAFRLPGTAPVPIQLTGVLPIIASRAGTLTIDGYTQPGSRANTAAYVSNAVPGVELLGNGVDAEEYGIYITSGGNTVRGLVMHELTRGIFIDGPAAVGNRVISNWIGFARDGSRVKRGETGIVVNQGATDTLIGGVARADRNVIGEWAKAVDLYGAGTDRTIVVNNLLCIRPAGTGIAGCGIGVDVDFGPKASRIGGSDPRERNVVGPTYRQAVELSHAWDPATGTDGDGRWAISDNLVEGNWLGLRADGTYDTRYRSGFGGTATDNGNGVNLTDGPTRNTVRGNVIASAFEGIGIRGSGTQGNLISGNRIGTTPGGDPAPMAEWGIGVYSGARSNDIVGNTIANAALGGIGLLHPAVRSIRLSRNRVSATKGPAIDLLGVPGPDPNDTDDADWGANMLLNTPRIIRATTALVRGMGLPGAIVEVYRASLGAGLRGLPVAYLGRATVAADGRWSLGIKGVRAGDRVTALQQAPDGDTSELGPNLRVVRR